jgi:transcriptional regulator with PAS, ATPase and Fis domain
MTGGPRPQPGVGPPPRLDAFVASDPPMARCLELARLAARTELPVLILGESGSGKTLLASAIHHSSRRAGAPSSRASSSATRRARSRARTGG